MQKRRIALVLTAAFLAGPSVAGAVNPPELFPGHYRQINPVTKKPLDVGNSIVLVRAKSGKLGFSINAIRALDSNQGFIAGTIQPGTKVVWTQFIPDAKCKLTFTAIPGGMTVDQDYRFGDCGFGYGVVADGTYRWMGEVGGKT
jgi:hypothetical protein